MISARQSKKSDGPKTCSFSNISVLSPGYRSLQYIHNGGHHPKKIDFGLKPTTERWSKSHFFGMAKPTCFDRLPSQASIPGASIYRPDRGGSRTAPTGECFSRPEFLNLVETGQPRGVAPTGECFSHPEFLNLGETGQPRGGCPAILFFA